MPKRPGAGHNSESTLNTCRPRPRRAGSLAERFTESERPPEARPRVGREGHSAERKARGERAGTQVQGSGPSVTQGRPMGLESRCRPDNTRARRAAAECSLPLATAQGLTGSMCEGGLLLNLDLNFSGSRVKDAKSKPGMVVHICNLSTQKAEAGGLPCCKTSLAHFHL